MITMRKEERELHSAAMAQTGANIPMLLSSYLTACSYDICILPFAIPYVHHFYPFTDNNNSDFCDANCVGHAEAALCPPHPPHPEHQPTHVQQVLPLEHQPLVQYLLEVLEPLLLHQPESRNYRTNC